MIRAVLRFAGGIAQIRTPDTNSLPASDNVGELSSFVKKVSHKYLSGWDELMAIEWHMGEGLPSNDNLFASYDRRSVGLYGYDFDPLCLANMDRVLDVS